MSSEETCISHYTYGEVKTANGQLLRFSCRPGDIEEVKKFLSTRIREIDIPTTGRVNVTHGSYGRYTRYNVTQHKYAGGGPGFIELLEIRNAPEERNGFVIFEYSHYGKSHFTEWTSLDDALNAFEQYWHSEKGAEIFPKLFGFVRKVECGYLSPWFYAVGEELLVGDYAFPDGLQDDPVFKIGTKVIVSDTNGIPSMKTCLGTRFIEDKNKRELDGKDKYRLVYFSDGTIWDERNYYPYWSSKGEYSKIRLITEGEHWIEEAVTQFQKLLSGVTTEFTIGFTDGNKFVGKFSKTNQNQKCAEGNYRIKVSFKDGRETAEGWVNDFVPTLKTPDISSYVEMKYKENGKVVDRVEVVESKVKPGGKKWSGVYFAK